MQPRGACSCEWTKKAVTVEKADAVEKAKDASEKVAVAVEKADAVEKAEDAAQKVAVADNPRARVILCTRMAIPTFLSDSCKRSFSQRWSAGASP